MAVVGMAANPLVPTRLAAIGPAEKDGRARLAPLPGTPIRLASCVAPR